MISTVDKKFIESILNREFEFYKFNFKPSTWQDAFIIELLKYYDNNVDIIIIEEDICFDELQIYYEQIVRILYYFVVYLGIHESKYLNKIFRYLFPDDIDNDIKSEKLTKVYDSLIKNINPCMKIDNSDREYIDVLIGKWNNEDMINKLKCIEVISVPQNMSRFLIVNINDNSYEEDNTEIDYDDMLIIIDFFKSFYSEVTLKKIGEIKK